MSQTQRDNSDLLDEPLTLWDKLIEALLIMLLAFMPLAFGAVHAWSELVVIALTGAMALCFALKLIVHPETRLVWSWAYIPLLIFLLVAVVQLIPLPQSLIESISSNTAAIKTELLGDLPNAAEVLDPMTLSFYPLATEHDLRLVLALAVVFLVAINVLRRPQQIKKILTAVTIIGGAIALLAMAQVLIGNGKIYWLIPTHDQAWSGTFINHSHYGQFMNLSIGAALGLLLVRLHEAFAGRAVELPDVVARLGEPDLRIIWYALAMMVLGAATIFISLTRGGMVSLLIALAFTALILAWKPSLKGRGWIIAMMALGSFICVLYIGFDSVYERLATLRDLQGESGGRWEMVKDIALAWIQFPLLGTGLGSHEVVYPMFDRATIPALASHAENEYAQIAEETGIIGLVMVLLFVIGIWASYVRTIRQGGLPIRSACFGLGFGLLAIMIHSFSDFGQHLPANAALTALFCGLLIGMARMKIPKSSCDAEKETDSPVVQFKRRPALIGLVSLIGIVAVWGWSLNGAFNAACAENQWDQVTETEERLAGKNWLGSNEEYGELLSHAQMAVDYQPKSVHYQHWLNAYRWRAISRVSDPNTGQIIVTDQTLKYTEQIVQQLHQARLLCPTFGATHCVAGQLEYFVLNETDAGLQHIRDGYRLAPYDATTCFVAALLDVQQENWEDSLEKFNRCLTLNSRLITDVLDVYVHQANRPDLAVALAINNIGWLGKVARLLSESGRNEELAQQARNQVTVLLEEKCSQPDAPAFALASLASICVRQDDYESAVAYYRRALAQDYGQVQWRLALARSLSQIEKIPEALHEAKIVLRLRPQMGSAQKLVQDLSVKPQ